jgi:copper chaperone CopZ
MKKLNTLFLLLAVTFTTVFANSTLNLSVKGMHCGGCETKFKSAATAVNGVTAVKSVSAANSTAVIEYDEKTVSAQELIKALADKTGYTIAASTGSEVTTAEGKPAGCCQKGQNNPSCKKEDKAKCAKSKCDKPKGAKGR